VIGFALVGASAAMNCGGDDTTTTTGPTGNAGSSTAGRGGSGGGGGRGGSGGSAAGTAGQGGGGGTGGSAGAGGRGGSGGAVGGGGAGGTAGSGGQRDAGDAGPETSTVDAPKDTPASDTPSSDALDAAAEKTFERPDGSVSFAEVADIFSRRCRTCHQPRETGTQLLDLVTADGLYTRLTSPLPDNQEGKCGFPDGGTADGGDGAPPPNRTPIVPGDTDSSFLFRKVAGTQPAGCGVRMPRISVTGEDGATFSVGCDQGDGGAVGNCLSQRDLDTLRDWITQGAPQ
jgi:hypothetical protein